MASGPLFAALASRALDHQEAARPEHRRFRWLAARLDQLATRQDPTAPMRAAEERLDRSHRRGRQHREPHGLSPGDIKDA
jgi:hypothetical protein